MWGTAGRLGCAFLGAACLVIGGSTLATPVSEGEALQSQIASNFQRQPEEMVHEVADATSWRNRNYGLTCDDTVHKPVQVSIHNGKGVARGAAIKPYDRWEVTVQRITQGNLARLGNVTAVLFACSPQPSNFVTQELRVYRSSSGSEISRIPHLSGGKWLPPEYQPASVAIRKDRIIADLKYYGPGDIHGSPSRLRHLNWTWNGVKFTTQDDGTGAEAHGRVDLARERVTVNGIGSLKLGASRKEAAKAIGAPIPGGSSERVCTDFTVQGGPEGLLLRFTSDRLVAIYVQPPAKSILTRSGIHIGSTRADVLNTYAGEIATVTPDYGGEELVFAPSGPEFSGKVIRFGMRDGIVETFIAGDRDWAVFAPSCGAAL
jgi:hypothetical protein